MREANRRRVRVNRRMWDESVPLHVRSADYDVAGFLDGQSSLHALEVAEVGPVQGLSLLHLQCHFGLDTLSWARRGARVTGVDFSPAAIRAARDLARSAHLRARFVRSDIYELPRNLRDRFDIVYTGKGAVCWLPDLGAWGRVVARYLKPGGLFYVLDDHPVSDTYDNDPSARKLVQRTPYFGSVPIRDESEGTYAAPEARMRNRVSYSWIHPVSELLGALLAAGLEIVAVREFPYAFWRKFSFTRRGRDGWWHVEKNEGMIPLMWSVKARKPA
jgi:SAM-dependent methyltransferase